VNDYFYPVSYIVTRAMTSAVERYTEAMEQRSDLSAAERERAIQKYTEHMTPEAFDIGVCGLNDEDNR
jgi:hypothetical protein